MGLQPGGLISRGGGGGGLINGILRCGSGLQPPISYSSPLRPFDPKCVLRPLMALNQSYNFNFP